MPSDWSSLPLLLKNVQVKLYNRAEDGRTRLVRIETDTGIKALDLTSIQAADGDSEIPCEVVGVEGKKEIKIRFHPEILEAAENNENIQEVLKKTVFKMLDQFLFSEWTIDAPVPRDNRFLVLRELQSILIQEAPLIEISSDYRTSVTWRVTSSMLSKSFKKFRSRKNGPSSILGEFFQKLSSSVFVFVRNVSIPRRARKGNFLDHIAKLPMDPPSQFVDIVYSKNGIRKTLISFEFAGFPPLDDSVKHSLHRMEFSEKLESIRLDLVPKFSRSQYYWTIPHDFGVLSYSRLLKTDGNWMIDCAQFRVQELRRELTDSLKDYPKAMIFGKSDSSDDNGKSLEVMFLSTNSVNVQIEAQSPVRRISLSGRFQVSPVTDAPPPSWKSPTKPLHVDALSPNVGKPSVVSPSESIDSGVASPGAISSDEEKKAKLDRDAADDVTFRSLKMRDRSASECFPYHAQQIPGLKGILKKPKSPLGFTVMNGTTGILRRCPASSRMLYARSVSECQDEMSLEIDFLEESTDNLGSGSPPREFFPVEEEEESSFLTDSESPPAEIRPRVKRVSFSEHVQARIYRSNSSITASKRKNEKKRKRREMRKENSLSGSDSTLNGDDSPLSRSLDDDSGLESNEKEDCLANEIPEIPSSMSSPSKRMKRFTSSDSALGEELDSEIEKQIEMLSVA
ncbi:hypothetical protein FO519_006014 [Halicephalobus sp. NKZ332]|nr:hypothetical protein FO519_006014 [Halicephalobus sp. NKZ332]